MATATAPKSKTRDNKVTRLIIPALYDSPGLTIKEIIDPDTNKPVEALYFYDARGLDKDGKPRLDKDGKPVTPLIEQMDEPVRTGKRGRPARRWKLTKATRDKVRKQRKRDADKYMANGGAEIGEAIANLEAIQAENNVEGGSA